MSSRKARQLMVAEILLDIGMEDDLIGAVTHLNVQEFQHLKK